MSFCFSAFLLVFQVAGGEGRGGGAQKRPEVICFVSVPTQVADIIPRGVSYLVK